MQIQTTFSSAPKSFGEPMKGHISLGSSFRAILFIIPVGLLGLILVIFRVPQSTIIGVEIVFAIIVGIVVSGVRVAAQWEKGVVLRLGKFHAIKGPGMVYILPILEHVSFVDTRIQVLNIPSQKVITKDNVPAQIDGVVFFIVTNAEKAILSIQDFKFAIAQYSQTALRDVVGGLTLDELLSEREQVQAKIGEIVEVHIKDWGLHVDSIRLQDIEVPEDLKKMMSRQASAEREKRATITKAEGDKMAALNLSEAAAVMRASPGAMRLRTLQTIDGLGPTSSNTVVIFPAELNDVAHEIGIFLGKKNREEKQE
jgi:regulator of protease activity HflC (stomatin/prohibitin superfamily)